MKLAAVAFAVGALAVAVLAVEERRSAWAGLDAAPRGFRVGDAGRPGPGLEGRAREPVRRRHRCKQERRSLCLLVERVQNTSVSGVLCVDQGRRKPELVFQHVTRRGRGPGQPISASISRAGRSGITVRFDPNEIGNAYTSLRWQVLSTSGCHAASKQCKAVFPARPALAKLHVPQVVGCVASGSSLVYGGSTKVHDIALTFDDGPWDTPPASAFLNVLEREHAVGTFFEIGEHIAPYDPGGTFERRMLADGDMIGDHSWSHPDVATLPVSQQRFQLVQTIGAIRKATGGFTPCLWRPPYGDISPELVSLARSLGLVTVMWDVDPRDWSLPGVSAIYDNVVRQRPQRRDRDPALRRRPALRDGGGAPSRDRNPAGSRIQVRDRRPDAGTPPHL